MVETWSCRWLRRMLVQTVCDSTTIVFLVRKSLKNSGGSHNSKNRFFIASIRTAKAAHVSLVCARRERYTKAKAPMVAIP